MELRLLDVEDLHGVALIRDKLDLSAAFLIPYLLQVALSADLKVRPRHKRDYIHNLKSVHDQVVDIVGCVVAGSRLQLALSAGPQEAGEDREQARCPPFS